MIVRKTKAGESRRVNELFSIAFELPLEAGPADEENQGVCHYAAFEDDDATMMSTLAITDFSVHFDGNSCKMGGVGGVATLPQYRRRGGIRGCFEKALPDMYESGYDFSYLYPFSTAYYRKFGYETCGQKLSWTVDLSLWRQSPPEGSWVLAEKGRTFSREIRRLDALWEERCNMMVIHGPEAPEWTEKIDPTATKEYTYVCFDRHQEPKAYTTFQTVMEPEGRNLVCSRFCFGDKEGFLLLMGLFQSMAADHRYVKFRTPLDNALQYFVPEWSLGAARWEILANGGMSRVICVSRVLEKARYRGSGQAVLQISDPHISQNNGCWEILFQEGRAVRVEKTSRVPDVKLTIQAFSALICGALEWESAREVLGGIEVQADSGLDRVFYPKKIMILDYF